MKKRFLTFILAIATMLMCIFGFSACGGNVEFKINFVVENEVYATVSTSGNEVISMPENPTKDDYTFDGWYFDYEVWQQRLSDDSFTVTPLVSDVSVYAKFTEIPVSPDPDDPSDSEHDFDSEEPKLGDVIDDAWTSITPVA